MQVLLVVKLSSILMVVPAHTVVVHSLGKIHPKSIAPQHILHVGLQNPSSQQNYVAALLFNFLMQLVSLNQSLSKLIPTVLSLKVKLTAI